MKLTGSVAGAMLMLMLTWGVQVSANVIRIPGVHVGDLAKYDFALNYTTNDPNPPTWAPPTVLSEIEYITVEVLSVSGVNVTSRNVTHYKNGTEGIYVGVTDISEGLSLLFIAANLSSGDSLHQTPFSLVVNATLVHSYAGVEREVNYVGFKQNVTNFPQGYRLVGDVHICWDRATGILAEMTTTQRYVHLLDGYVTQVFIQFVIAETNIWRSCSALFGDLNSDQKVDVRDIAVAALAFGSFPDHLRWNPVADLNEDDKIDLKDILAIARNFGT